MNYETLTQNDELRRAALAARERSRVLRATMEARSENDGALQKLARPFRRPTPEHYHIIYHVPSENLAIPYYKQVFATQREVYERLQEMALESEPNTEWYEEGLVGIETTLHGRAGLWWLLLEPACCIRSACRTHLPKDFARRRLVLLHNEDTLPVIRST
jgi:hypothetical protein